MVRDETFATGDDGQATRGLFRRDLLAAASAPAAFAEPLKAAAPEPSNVVAPASTSTL